MELQEPQPSSVRLDLSSHRFVHFDWQNGESEVKTWPIFVVPASHYSTQFAKLAHRRVWADQPRDLRLGLNKRGVDDVESESPDCVLLLLVEELPPSCRLSSVSLRIQTDLERLQRDPVEVTVANGSKRLHPVKCTVLTLELSAMLGRHRWLDFLAGMCSTHLDVVDLPADHEFGVFVSRVLKTMNDLTRRDTPSFLQSAPSKPRTLQVQDAKYPWVFMLMQLPGVSEALATALCAVYPSMGCLLRLAEDPAKFRSEVANTRLLLDGKFRRVGPRLTGRLLRLCRADAAPSDILTEEL
ncbi:MAG: uncharacterized protein KVP18_003740 [Porospora cf. gigantea A]|uniref:uncharacterized protein n=1 Tax=Porospora cf. gigantea A TaxID=2853593 RepID=UPI003559394C|nr:MAG: hypothetical protein KVP18_003740 [Porospora cf. gigantea A]